MREWTALGRGRPVAQLTLSSPNSPPARLPLLEAVLIERPTTWRCPCVSLIVRRVSNALRQSDRFVIGEESGI